MTIFRSLQAFQLASALTLTSPLLTTGCGSSAQPTDESAAVAAGSGTSVRSVPPPLPSARGVSGTPIQLLANDPHATLTNAGVPVARSDGPTIGAPASSSSGGSTAWQILAVLGALTTAALTYSHLKLRRDQAYAQMRGLGLTLEADIKRMEERLSKSAGDRDHWHREFLTDLGKVAQNGLLRPARCRTEDIVDLMKLRKRNLPVISTVVAPSGAGKSRMVEGLVHSLYHDRDGRHFTDENYDANRRLFPDIDPTNLLCYRINLGQLTHADAEIMFHYLMQKADRCVTEGGRCLVIIDDVHFLYGPNGHASAARLIHLIDGWTDGQMKDNKGLWGIAMSPLQKYEELIGNVPSRERRFERYDMTVLSGGRLRAVVDETLGEWERRLGIGIPEVVRDRAMELMHHERNKMANPYAILNLLDRVASDMAPGQQMTVQALNQSFARLHRLTPEEVSRWALYADVERGILAELKERFAAKGDLPALADDKDFPNILPRLAQQILRDWKSSEQAYTRAGDKNAGQPLLAESFLQNGIDQLYRAIASTPLTQRPNGINAHVLKERMIALDAGKRAHRNTNVSQLPNKAAKAAANG